MRTKQIPTGVTLPSKFTALRPHQHRAVDEIVAAFEDGARVVFLDAPVGSGKTVVAECVRQILGGQANYICSTKSLQSQFINDFGYAKLLQGKNNYVPLDTHSESVTCEDCDKERIDSDNDEHGEEYVCSFCEYPSDCPYAVAKKAAIKAPLAVLNNAYYFAETTSKVSSSFWGRELGIVDEGDMLESTLQNHVEFRVTEKEARALKVTIPPEDHSPLLLADWIGQLIAALDKYIPKLNSTSPESKKERRHYQYMQRQAKQLDLTNSDRCWVRVVDAPYGKKSKYFKSAFIMKSFNVAAFGHSVIWDKSHKWLVMSGSIFPDMDAPSLGLTEDEWATVTMPMTFPPEHRPIIFRPVGLMTWKKETQTTPKMVEEISAICQDHPNENILVHCVSTNRAHTLGERVKSSTHKVLTYNGATERDKVIAAFEGDEPVIVFAQSLDRGIDLAGDKCRVQIIAKIPFGVRGDPVIKARLRHDKSGELWYATETARKLIQMAGRIVRTPTDKGTTYILDSSYDVFVRDRGGKLLPDWWLDVVEYQSVAKIRGERTQGA